MQISLDGRNSCRERIAPPSKEATKNRCGSENWGKTHRFMAFLPVRYEASFLEQHYGTPLFKVRGRELYGGTNSLSGSHHSS